MKKLVFLFMLFSFNANAEDRLSLYLPNQIGAECLRILFNLQIYTYPTYVDKIKPRNSQLWALNKCLEVYKKNGGNLANLSGTYHFSKKIYDYEAEQCGLIKDDNLQKSCFETAESFFNRRIRGDILLSVINYNAETDSITSISLSDAMFSIFGQDSVSEEKKAQ